MKTKKRRARRLPNEDAEKLLERAAKQLESYMRVTEVTAALDAAEQPPASPERSWDYPLTLTVQRRA